MNDNGKLVLAYGATGTQGRAIMERLLQRGYRIRAVVRNAGKAADLAERGVDVRAVDFRDVGALTKAGQGVDAISVLIPVSLSVADMLDFATNALTAARDARVPDIVVTISSVVPNSPTGKESPDARLKIAELVSELVPHATRLNATLYLENFSQALRPAVEQGIIPQAIPEDVPVAYLSLGDLASFVVTALEQPELAGRAFALGGGEALTGAQLADALSEAMGRPVRYQALPPEAMIPMLAEIAGETVARQVAEMYSWEGAEGRALLAPNLTSTLQALPIELTPVRTWAQRAMR